MKTSLLSLTLLSAVIFANTTQAQQAVTMTNADGTPMNQAELTEKILGSYVGGGDNTTYAGVAWPLFTHAADAGLCKDVVYRLGYTPKVLDSKLEESYVGSTGKFPGLTVNYVTPNSPIALAGLKENDVFVSVNGETIKTTGRNISRNFAEMLDDATNLAAGNGGQVTLEVLQGTSIKTLKVAPVKSCNLTISSAPDGGRFNDEPDPKKVLVSQTVMEQASDDVERQIVIAYSMSKNLSGAVATKRNINKTAKFLNNVLAFAPLALPVNPSMLGMAGMGLGGLVQPAGNAIAGVASGSKAGENDEISLAVLKSAGISAQQVVDFWEKYLESDSNSIVLRWVNGSDMTDKRLNKIRLVAQQESVQTASVATQTSAQ